MKKIKIIKTTEYLFQTRGIKVGNKFNIEKIGMAEKSNRKVYLITPKKGNSIVIYENECEVLN